MKLIVWQNVFSVNIHAKNANLRINVQVVSFLKIELILFFASVWRGIRKMKIKFASSVLVSLVIILKIALVKKLSVSLIYVGCVIKISTVFNSGKGLLDSYMKELLIIVFLIVIVVLMTKHVSVIFFFFFGKLVLYR